VENLGSNWETTSGKPHLGDHWDTMERQAEDNWETIGRQHLYDNWGVSGRQVADKMWETTQVGDIMGEGRRYWETQRETSWETSFPGCAYMKEQGEVATPPPVSGD